MIEIPAVGVIDCIDLSNFVGSMHVCLLLIGCLGSCPAGLKAESDLISSSDYSSIRGPFRCNFYRLTFLKLPRLLLLWECFSGEFACPASIEYLRSGFGLKTTKKTLHKLIKLTFFDLLEERFHFSTVYRLLVLIWGKFFDRRKIKLIDTFAHLRYCAEVCLVCLARNPGNRPTFFSVSP